MFTKISKIALITTVLLVAACGRSSNDGANGNAMNNGGSSDTTDGTSETTDGSADGSEMVSACVASPSIDAVNSIVSSQAEGVSSSVDIAALTTELASLCAEAQPLVVNSGDDAATVLARALGQ